MTQIAETAPASTSNRITEEQIVTCEKVLRHIAGRPDIEFDEIDLRQTLAATTNPVRWFRKMPLLDVETDTDLHTVKRTFTHLCIALDLRQVSRADLLALANNVLRRAQSFRDLCQLKRESVYTYRSFRTRRLSEPNTVVGAQEIETCELVLRHIAAAGGISFNAQQLSATLSATTNKLRRHLGMPLLDCSAATHSDTQRWYIDFLNQVSPADLTKEDLLALARELDNFADRLNDAALRCAC